ncbi:hypothetical protein HY489_02435 [Candidatus Woesearchaeota archaeon]|nr:hypothetical protein [Candidatus Woesearchaeota archaeon]
MMPRAYYEAIATMTGCIVGAGILAIPYVVVRSGFWTGMLVLLVLGFVTLVIHLLAGEVSLRAKECHQLVGLAGKFLGRKGKIGMLLSMVVGVYGALVAYTLGVGESLSALFGLSPWAWSVLFYLFMAIVLLGGLRVLAGFELWVDAFKFVVLILVLIVLFSSSSFSSSRWTGFSFGKLLLPYGVILFSFLGTAAIPEVREELKKCALLTKRALIIGSLIPIAAYALFTAAAIGVSGGFTTEVASVGLSSFVGPVGFFLLHLFGIAAMTTAFVALGFALKQVYLKDFRLPELEAWSLVVAVPAMLLFLGAGFIRTLDVAGAFAGGTAGVLIVAMHAAARRRSERKPEYSIRIGTIGYGFLLVIFGIGMLYQLILFL